MRIDLCLEELHLPEPELLLFFLVLLYIPSDIIQHFIIGSSQVIHFIPASSLIPQLQVTGSRLFHDILQVLNVAG